MEIVLIIATLILLDLHHPQDLTIISTPTPTTVDQIKEDLMQRFLFPAQDLLSSTLNLPLKIASKHFLVICQYVVFSFIRIFDNIPRNIIGKLLIQTKCVAASQCSHVIIILMR